MLSRVSDCPVGVADLSLPFQPEAHPSTWDLSGKPVRLSTSNSLHGGMVKLCGCATHVAACWAVGSSLLKTFAQQQHQLCPTLTRGNIISFCPPSTAIQEWLQQIMGAASGKWTELSGSRSSHSSSKFLVFQYCRSALSEEPCSTQAHRVPLPEAPNFRPLQPTLTC